MDGINYLHQQKEHCYEPKKIYYNIFNIYNTISIITNVLYAA